MSFLFLWFSYPMNQRSPRTVTETTLDAVHCDAQGLTYKTGPGVTQELFLKDFLLILVLQFVASSV
jgi:hypothetical protein